jgi:hypothetical protein
MKFRILIASITFAVLMVPSANSVKIDGPEEAEINSTHIITGTVTAIYSRVTRTENQETTYCLGQILVEGVEKAGGLSKGLTVFVRYIGGMKWIGPGFTPPGPGPHLNCPEEGEKVRVCLVKNPDGAFDVYYVSGFRKLGEK